MAKGELSVIARNIPASPIRYLAPYAIEASKKGRKIFHLNIGDPDVESPAELINVLKSWSGNPIGYAHSQGDHKLIKSLLGYYRKIGFDFLNEENIQVTLGGSEGLMWAFMSVCDPGDEIVTFEPFYTNYNSYAVMTGVKVVPVTTSIENGFHLPPADTIEKAITNKTKAILICNPSNPTGTVFSQGEMDMLMDIAKRNDLFVISDEVYREYVYGGRKAISVLTYIDSSPEMKERIIMVDSLSKRYSLCGARLGCVVSLNKDLMAAFLKYGQARLSAGFIDQRMAAELSNVSDSYFETTIAEYDKRRQVLVNGLGNIPGVVCSEPEGAFYVIVKLPVDDAANFAKWLLTDFEYKNETVMVAPASGFYSTPGLGKDEVRIAYVLNVEALERSIEIIKRGLDLYRGTKKSD